MYLQLSLKSITTTSVVFALLIFATAPFAREALALGDEEQLRPDWIKSGDYVTYLYSRTAMGITETIHIRETVKDDNGIYLNRMRIERFDAQTSPDLPSSLPHLSPSVEEATSNMVVYDDTFVTSEKVVASMNPEIEQVHGLNNRTYEAYKIVLPELFTAVGTSCHCNKTIWFEKESLVKVRELDWWNQDGIDVKAETLIEDSNIPQLITPALSTTPANIVTTTTVYITAPQIIITTTTTTTATSNKTVMITSTATTTLTNTITITSTERVANTSIYVWVGATVIAAVLAVVLLRKKR